MLSKNLIKDMNWAVNDPPCLNFSLHLHDLLDEGFEMKNQFGQFEGESFESEDERLSWVVLTHDEAGVTVKVTSNQFFGTTLVLINDKYNIIEKTKSDA